MLRKAREAKGLSLDDLIRSTKISRSMLQALERRDLTTLPAAIYTRGFIKSYAKEVGLDPDATASAYFSQVELASPRHLVTPGIAAPPSSMATDAQAMTLDADPTRMLPAEYPRRFGRLVSLTCLVGLVAYVWSVGRQPPVPIDEPTQESRAASDAAPAAGAPSAATDAVPALPPSADASSPLRVEISARGPCWVQAAADGTSLVTRLLQAGEQQTLEAAGELTLRIGDPAAFSYSINGRQGRPLGQAGQPVTVRITRENAGDFLGS